MCTGEPAIIKRDPMHLVLAGELELLGHVASCQGVVACDHDHVVGGVEQLLDDPLGVPLQGTGNHHETGELEPSFTLVPATRWGCTLEQRRN